MKRIPLYRKDGTIRVHTLVDDEDYVRLGRYRWCLDSKGYVYRHCYRAGTHESYRLHREVLEQPNGNGLIVDHVNGDKLDNRRANLRAGTQSLNQQNRRKQRGTSRYRGVTRYRNGKWMAQCQLNGKLHHLGYFDDEDEAGAAAAAFRAANLPWSAEGQAAREK